MTSDSLIENLSADLQEFELLMQTATRPNVKDFLHNKLSEIKVNIEKLEKAKLASQTQTDEVAVKSTLYTTKISQYGWDESSKFVRLYVTIPQIENLREDQISCEFTSTSVKFIAQNHLNKNHLLQIVGLAYSIVPKESTCKIKSGNVVISMKKDKEGRTWGNVTAVERKEKEAKDSKLNSKDMDSSDPQAGIMNLMKKMYDEGDDDMKRMIKKTWYESQQKQKEGGGL
ncbi:calcyclin-binding protein isoform X1 [Hydra vulgaris]|nr:calcyclin-binding protein [Hydra vulgaris]